MKPKQPERARIGLLGGTFDPVHIGHLVSGQEVQAQLGLQYVYFVPAGQPPHKLNRPISSATHRLAMLELAIVGNPAFRISSVDLQREGPSYTVDTLTLLQGEHPDADLYFIMGWDGLADLPTWRQPEQIIQRCYVAVVHRPGYEDNTNLVARLEATLPGLRERLVILEAPQLAIAANDLRRRVSTRLPIRYLVPEAVERYIYTHHLYSREAQAEEPTPPTHPD